jgi:hypothetical protein
MRLQSFARAAGVFFGECPILAAPLVLAQAEGLQEEVAALSRAAAAYSGAQAADEAQGAEAVRGLPGVAALAQVAGPAQSDFTGRAAVGGMVFAEMTDFLARGGDEGSAQALSPAAPGAKGGRRKAPGGTAGRPTPSSPGAAASPNGATGAATSLPVAAHLLSASLSPFNLALPEMAANALARHLSTPVTELFPPHFLERWLKGGAGAPGGAGRSAAPSPCALPAAAAAAIRAAEDPAVVQAAIRYLNSLANDAEGTPSTAAMVPFPLPSADASAKNVAVISQSVVPLLRYSPAFRSHPAYIPSLVDLIGAGNGSSPLDLDCHFDDAPLPAALRFRTLPLLSEVFAARDAFAALPGADGMSGAWSAQSASALAFTKRSARRDRSLGVLTQRFIKLFLLGKRVLTLDYAASIVIPDDLGDDDDDDDAGAEKKPGAKPKAAKAAATKASITAVPGLELVSAPGPSSGAALSTAIQKKARRLYDIANVLCALGLVDRVHARVGNQRRPAFRWRGPAYVSKVPGCTLPQWALRKVLPGQELGLPEWATDAQSDDPADCLFCCRPPSLEALTQSLPFLTRVPSSLRASAVAQAHTGHASATGAALGSATMATGGGRKSTGGTKANAAAGVKSRAEHTLAGVAAVPASIAPFRVEHDPIWPVEDVSAVNLPKRRRKSTGAASPVAASMQQRGGAAKRQKRAGSAGFTTSHTSAPYPDDGDGINDEDADEPTVPGSAERRRRASSSSSLGAVAEASAAALDALRSSSTEDVWSYGASEAWKTRGSDYPEADPEILAAAAAITPGSYARDAQGRARSRCRSAVGTGASSPHAETAEEAPLVVFAASRGSGLAVPSRTVPGRAFGEAAPPGMVEVAITSALIPGIASGLDTSNDQSFSSILSEDMGAAGSSSLHGAVSASASAAGSVVHRPDSASNESSTAAAMEAIAARYAVENPFAHHFVGMTPAPSHRDASAMDHRRTLTHLHQMQQRSGDVALLAHVVGAEAASTNTAPPITAGDADAVLALAANASPVVLGRAESKFPLWSMAKPSPQGGAQSARESNADAVADVSFAPRPQSARETSAFMQEVSMDSKERSDAAATTSSATDQPSSSSSAPVTAIPSTPGPLSFASALPMRGAVGAFTGLAVSTPSAGLIGALSFPPPSAALAAHGSSGAAPMTRMPSSGLGWASAADHGTAAAPASASAAASHSLNQSMVLPQGMLAQTPYGYGQKNVVGFSPSQLIVGHHNLRSVVQARTGAIRRNSMHSSLPNTDALALAMIAETAESEGQGESSQSTNNTNGSVAVDPMNTAETSAAADSVIGSSPFGASLTPLPHARSGTLSGHVLHQDAGTHSGDGMSHDLSDAPSSVSVCRSSRAAEVSAAADGSALNLQDLISPANHRGIGAAATSETASAQSRNPSGPTAAGSTSGSSGASSMAASSSSVSKSVVSSHSTSTILSSSALSFHSDGSRMSMVRRHGEAPSSADAASSSGALASKSGGNTSGAGIDVITMSALDVSGIADTHSHSTDLHHDGASSAHNDISQGRPHRRFHHGSRVAHLDDKETTSLGALVSAEKVGKATNSAHLVLTQPGDCDVMKSQLDQQDMHDQQKRMEGLVGSPLPAVNLAERLNALIQH